MDYTGLLNNSNLSINIGGQTIEESIFVLCQSYNFQSLMGFVLVLLVNLSVVIYYYKVIRHWKTSKEMDNYFFQWLIPVYWFNVCIMILFIGKMLLGGS